MSEMPAEKAPTAAPPVTVAVCTYNRAARLPELVRALRAQTPSVPFRVLVVDNNSSDDTPAVLARLAAEPGPRLDVVREATQGIVPARNRAIEESFGSDYLLFMDDDELPRPGWVQAGVDALRQDGVDCAGGRVIVRFEPGTRPRWLGDDLLGFLAEVNYGEAGFRIRDESTPVWTANVGYRTALFCGRLRFDHRYSRAGKGAGGGEDVMMFRRLLERGAGIAYVPEMVVEHWVEAWRLERRYFLRAHYSSGYRHGLYEMGAHARTVRGVPVFLFGQALRHGLRTLAAWAGRRPGRLRQAMTFAHACGMIAGCHERWRRGVPATAADQHA
jgi:glycosyltransferase involved in cell wall biosynthesis